MDVVVYLAILVPSVDTLILSPDRDREAKKSVMLNRRQSKQIQERPCTYTSQCGHTCLTTPCTSVIWEPKRVLQDGMCHPVGGTAVERTFVEQQLVSGDTEAPPVYLPGVSLPTDYLGRHVCHAACNTCV